jgi:Spy/CpxP family protein refolding chaperone
MRISKTFVLLILIGIIMNAGLAFGQEHRVVKMKKTGGGNMMGIENLSEEQQTEIKSLRMALQKSILPLKSDLEVAQAELKKMMIADSPNQSAIEKKVETIGKLRIEMQKLQVVNQLNIRKLLNEEQKVAFDKRILEGRQGQNAPMKKMLKLRRIGELGDPVEIEEEFEITE